MGTHNTGFVSLISPCATKKAPLMRKATGNHLLKSTFLEKAQYPVLVSATIEIEYATQQFLLHMVEVLVIKQNHKAKS